MLSYFFARKLLQVDVMRWVNDRFFPSKSEAALGGLARCFAAAWKKVKGFFASILPACCGGGGKGGGNSL